MNNFVRLSAADNVVVLPQGGAVGSFAGGVRLSSDIPARHKTASEDIAAGEQVIKYGRPIGIASMDIKIGDWVHEHNVLSPPAAQWAAFPEWSGPYPAETGSPVSSFMGYRRIGALRPGIRNDLWVIPSVGCVREEIKYILENYHKPYWIDSVRLFDHPFGSDMDDGGAALDIPLGLARGPNTAGVLFVGPGRENIQVSDLYNSALADGCHAMFAITQKNAEDTIPRLLDDLAATAPRVREEFTAKFLCAGVISGGEYSGALANSLLGRFACNLSSQGGTVLAATCPEMFRAPFDMTSRMTKKTTYDAYSAMYRLGSDNLSELSPDDRENGVTTMDEKSAAARAIIGESQIAGVLRYGETATLSSGVQLAPGSPDSAEACASVAGSGAHMILFVTGRDAQFSAAVPTIKIAASTDLASWADFDASPILDGEPLENASERLWSYVLDVACGKRVAHEIKGFGDIALLT